MAVYKLGTKIPRIPSSAYVAAEATVIGEVVLGEGANVWPGAVLRGDNEPIVIGANTNIQEGAVLHADPGTPLTVGANVSIGHQAMHANAADYVKRQEMYKSQLERID